MERKVDFALGKDGNEVDLTSGKYRNIEMEVDFTFGKDGGRG